MLTHLRGVAISAALLVCALIPTGAAANAPYPQTMEPVVIAPGFIGCGVQLTNAHGHSSAFNGLLNDTTRHAAWNWRPTGAPAGQVPLAVPANRVYVWKNDWSIPAGQQYNQCGTSSLWNLTQRFYSRLGALRAEWNMPASQQFDVIGVSLGSVVTRGCINNITGQTPNCAAWIDDWVGLAGPAHGSDLVNQTNCQWAGFLLATSTQCMQLEPGGDFITDLNAGDESAGNGEFSTVWSANDGVVVPGSRGIVAGAANWQVKAAPGSATSTDPTHANGLSAGSCQGWGNNPATAWDESTVGSIHEWTVYELLDIQPHGVGNGFVYCNQGPPNT